MKRVGALAVVLSLGCLVAAGCQGATQVLLDVRTSVDCSDPTRWRGVAIYVGAPGLDVESRAPSLTTSECHPGGEIGTLVITPRAGKDDEIGIRVVAGITTNPEDCAAKNYAGCIVARRATRFRHQESASIVVALEATCIGNACDTARTTQMPRGRLAARRPQAAARRSAAETIARSARPTDPNKWAFASSVPKARAAANVFRTASAKAPACVRTALPASPGRSAVPQIRRPCFPVTFHMLPVSPSSQGRSVRLCQHDRCVMLTKRNC